MAFFQTKLKAGSRAPDFKLRSHLGGKVRLSDFKGKKNVLLAFYPMDWTPVCTNQIPGYEKDLDRFNELETQVLSVSVDSVPCHQAWQKTLGGITFPLLADNSPHGEVSRKYGVLTESDIADRVIFLIDKKGVIRFIDYAGMDNLPDNELIINRIKELGE